MTTMTLDAARIKANALRKAIGDVVLGRNDDITFLLTALLANGHILLEDFPGSGKTLMAVRLAEAISDDDKEEDYDIRPFQRVQGTPDLFPSDIIGSERLNTVTREIQFEHGPIFAYVFLLDEINRAPAKVQSACLEAMAERQVTVGKQQYKLSKLFFVIGTQNPLDQKGTYELPAAQLDRFLFKRVLKPIDENSERTVLLNSHKPIDKSAWTHKILSKGDILAMQEVIASDIAVEGEIIELLLGMAAAVDRRVDGRPDAKGVVPVDGERLKRGSRPSTRSLKKLMDALRAHAFLRGDEKVITADVRAVAGDFFRHRLFPVKPLDNLQMNALIDGIVKEAIECRQKAGLNY
jgi:MoxR-like ATPase